MVSSTWPRKNGKMAPKKLQVCCPSCSSSQRNRDAPFSGPIRIIVRTLTGPIWGICSSWSHYVAWELETSNWPAWGRAELWLEQETGVFTKGKRSAYYQKKRKECWAGKNSSNPPTLPNGCCYVPRTLLSILPISSYLILISAWDKHYYCPLF